LAEETGSKPTKRPTLAEVAGLAGVSKTSASMALADNERVAPDTREAVKRAAEALHYVPHAAASALRSQRTVSVAVALPHAAHHVFSHPIFIDLLEGITAVANELDLSVILSTARSAEDERSAYSRIMRGRQAGGVIVAAASITDPNPIELNAAGYSVVVVGRLPNSSSVPSVSVDDVGGARAAVDHLTNVHGVTRIGHVSGPLDHQSSVDKRDAYIDALKTAGLSMDPRLLYEGNYEEESGSDAAAAMLPSLRPGDGVFFANDQMAIGALETWRRSGLRVPDDLKMVAYDNHPMSRHVSPPLTTVGADMVSVGEACMRMLHRLLSGDTVLEPEKFPTELIIRESCGCRRTDDD